MPGTRNKRFNSDGHSNGTRKYLATVRRRFSAGAVRRGRQSED